MAIYMWPTCAQTAGKLVRAEPTQSRTYACGIACMHRTTQVAGIHSLSHRRSFPFKICAMDPRSGICAPVPPMIALQTIHPIAAGARSAIVNQQMMVATTGMVMEVATLIFRPHGRASATVNTDVRLLTELYQATIMTMSRRSSDYYAR